MIALTDFVRGDNSSDGCNGTPNDQTVPGRFTPVTFRTGVTVSFLPGEEPRWPGCYPGKKLSSRAKKKGSVSSPPSQFLLHL